MTRNFPFPLRRDLGSGISRLRADSGPSSTAGHRMNSSVGAAQITSPPFSPDKGSHLDDIVCRFDHLAIVFDDDHGVARTASSLQNAGERPYHAHGDRWSVRRGRRACRPAVAPS